MNDILFETVSRAQKFYGGIGMNKEKKFETGQVVMTRGIGEFDKDPAFHNQIVDCYNKHISGDWGILGEDDKKMNDDAVINGDDRILSKYATCKGEYLHYYRMGSFLYDDHVL